MSLLKTNLLKDKKILLQLCIWFLISSIILWNVNVQFFVLIPFLIFIVLSIPILLIYTFISWIRQKHSFLPCLFMLCFTLFWFIFPENEIKAHTYYSKHKEELIATSTKMKEDLFQNVKNQVYELEDGTNIDLDIQMDPNDFYFKLSINNILLANETQWIVYASNNTIENAEHFLSLQIEDYKQLDDCFYFVKGLEVDQLQQKSKTSK